MPLPMHRIRKLHFKAQTEEPVELLPRSAAELRRVFGDRVRDLRRRKGMTQTTLAAAAEMDRADVSNLERGKQNPRLETIIRLARALDVDPPELLRGLR